MLRSSIRSFSKAVIPLGQDDYNNRGRRKQTRSQMIARTESKRAEQRGVLEAAIASSVRRVMWHAEPGACEFCAALDGSYVSKGKPFIKQGSEFEGVDGGTMVNDFDDLYHPPAHPNCRCSIQPVVIRREQ